MISLQVNYNNNNLELGKARAGKKLGIFTIFKITKNTYAPAIWAGTEGLQFYTDKDNIYEIIGVDLQNRIIITRRPYFIL